MNPAMHISRSDMEKFSQTNAKFETLPLPTNYFSRVRMTDRQHAEYVATARGLLDEALGRLGDAKERTAQLREWKELGSQGGFRRFAQRVSGGDQRFRVEGTARTSLNNLMGALFADTTSQMQVRRQNLFRDLLDAQTLCVLQPRAVSLDSTAQEEFIALRWQAVSLGATSTAQHWDMCFLEYTGVATDNDGFPVGFHITQSIDRPECGLLKETYGLSRLRGREIILLFPAKGSNQGHTEIVLDGCWKEPENVSTWVIQSFLAVASSSLSKLALLVQEQLLARLPLKDKSQLVPLSDRKTCNVCLSKFGMMGKKSQCRSCGEVVCKACVVTRNVGVQAKFCKKCLIEVSTQRVALESSLSVSDYGYDRRSSSSSGTTISRHTTTSSSAMSSSAANLHARRQFGSETSTVSSSSHSGAIVPSGKMMRMNSSNRIVTNNNAIEAQKPGAYYDSYGYSMASTASVSSYDSFSDSVIDRPGSEIFDVDEDGVLVVSTKSAMRAMGTPSHTRAMVNSSGVPSVQAVEDSIAHQRFILNEMMSTARTMQQQQQARSAYTQYH